MTNIHANCISIANQGVIIIGPSNSGKSDITLRLIMSELGKLVSDDRVDINVSHETSQVIASPPIALAGLLEVRGVGIIEVPHLSQIPVRLVVELVSNPEDLERMPLPEFYDLEGIRLPKIRVYPFEISAADKIAAFLKYELHSK